MKLFDHSVKYLFLKTPCDLFFQQFIYLIDQGIKQSPVSDLIILYFGVDVDSFYSIVFLCIIIFGLIIYWWILLVYIWIYKMELTLEINYIEITEITLIFYNKMLLRWLCMLILLFWYHVADNLIFDRSTDQNPSTYVWYFFCFVLLFNFVYFYCIVYYFWLFYC